MYRGPRVKDRALARMRKSDEIMEDAMRTSTRNSMKLLVRGCTAEVVNVNETVGFMN
jgi:hypothetical protein